MSRRSLKELVDTKYACTECLPNYQSLCLEAETPSKLTFQNFYIVGAAAFPADMALTSS